MTQPKPVVSELTDWISNKVPGKSSCKEGGSSSSPFDSWCSTWRLGSSREIGGRRRAVRICACWRDARGTDARWHDALPGPKLLALRRCNPFLYDGSCSGNGGVESAASKRIVGSAPADQLDDCPG